MPNCTLYSSTPFSYPFFLVVVGFLQQVVKEKEDNGSSEIKGKEISLYTK